jgi:hypothetical protein
VEHSYKDSRHKYIPASSYPTAKEDLLLDLVEIFKATALTSSAVHAEEEEMEEVEEEGPAAHSQEEDDEPAVEEEEIEPVVEIEVEQEVEQDSSSAIVTPQKADSYHDILAEEAVLLLSTPAPPVEVLDLHDLDDDADAANDDPDALLAEQQQDILENDDEGGFESGEDW